MALCLWVVIAAVLSGACGRFGFGSDPPASDSPPLDMDAPTIDAPPNTGTTRVFAYETINTVTPRLVSIAPVDPASTFVFCSFRTSQSNANHRVLCNLIDSTTVEVRVGVADSFVIINIQVIELPTGNRVQRGLATIGPTELTRTVAIAPVDQSRAFALVFTSAPLDLGSRDADLAFTGVLSGAGLELTRLPTSSVDVDVAWQVVELAAGGVRAGDTALPTGMATATLPITPVDPTRAWVIMASRGGNGHECDSQPRARLVDGSTLEILRESANADIAAAWYVIEQPDVAVQHGELLLDPLQQVVPISAVDVAHAAVFHTVSGGVLADSAQYDSVSVTGVLQSTSITFAHEPDESTTTNTRVTWSVVTWQ